MGITAQEVIDHARGDLARWLSAEGNDVPQHELEAAIDRLLLIDLASRLANAATCAALADPYIDGPMADYARRQLWNWE